jgi:hypothetical protein
LICGGIRMTGRLIGSSPPKQIESDYSSWWREAGNKAIIEVHIIRKAMHQDNGRLPPPEYSRGKFDVDSVGQISLRSSSLHQEGATRENKISYRFRQAVQGWMYGRAREYLSASIRCPK